MPHSDALQRKLMSLQNLGALLASPMRDSAALINNRLSDYPPLSEANQPPDPPPGRFYIRHTGGFYVTEDRRMYCISASERLGSNWRKRYTFRPDLARAEISTGVSYAPYVHGTQQQKRYHRRRGWQTIQMIFDKYKIVIMNNLAQAIKRAMQTS